MIVPLKNIILTSKDKKNYFHKSLTFSSISFQVWDPKQPDASFVSNVSEIWLAEIASDSEKWHYKKLISQELKHMSPSCKKNWKAYLILLRNNNHSFINSHSPFCVKVLLSTMFLLKVFLQWHLHVFPKHVKLYIDEIRD